MTRSENYLREFASILFSQKHVIFWTTLLVFAGAVLVKTLWPPFYSATGSILVSGKQLDVNAPEALDKMPSAKPFEAAKEDLAAEMAILLSPDVIRNALRALNSPTLTPTNEQIFQVQSQLKAAPVPASNVITVEYRDRNQAQAVQLLTALLNEYYNYRTQFYKPVVSQLTSTFLGERADREREALEGKERQLIGLVDDSGVANPEQEIDNNLLFKKRLEEERNTLAGQHIELKATLDHLASALEKRDLQYFAFLESPTITKLGERLTELTLERGKRARTYLPGSEVVRTIDEQINDTFASLKAEVQTIMEAQRKKLKATSDKIALIEGSIGAYDTMNIEMQKQIIHTEQIKREANLLQYSYETLTKRKSEVEINDLVAPKGAATMSVSILSKAFPSDGPVFPKPLVIPLGLLVGLITGFMLGFLREYFDHTFKRPSDVATYVNLPVLFSLAGPEGSAWSNYLYLAGSLAMFLGTLVFLLVQYKVLPLP